MSISGSYDFSMSRDQIITGAIRLLGITDPTIPTQDSMVHHVRSLNTMLKSWQLQGVGLWLLRQLYLFPTLNIGTYSMSGSGANCTLTPIETTLAADAALGATTITVASATGLLTTVNIGIKLDSLARQWTTINGAPSGVSIPLTAALTGAATSGNTVKAYAAKVQRPLRILEARWKIGDNEVPINVVDQKDYLIMPNKTTTGMPIMLYYDPQLSAGVLHLWPAPNVVDSVIVMTAAYPISDMDSSSDDFELPVEFLQAIKYGLASELIPEYPDRINEQMAERVEERAKREFKIAKNYDSPISVRFVSSGE